MVSLIAVTSSVDADDEDLNSYFSLSPDPLYSYIILGITLAALVFSLLALVVDAASGRQRPRVVTHGVSSDATSTFVRNYKPIDSPQQPPQPQSEQQQQQPRTHSNSNDPRQLDQPQTNNCSTSTNNKNNNSSSIDSPPVPSPDIAEAKPNLSPTDDDNAETDPEAASADPEVSASLKDEDDIAKGKKSQKRDKSKQRRKRPKGQIRTIVSTILARLVFCSIILSAAALSIYLLVTIIRDGPFGVLASDETNRWLESVIQRSMLQYASLTARPELANDDVTEVGLSREMYKVDELINLSDSWRWMLLFLLIIIYILGGVFIRLLKGFIPTANRAVAYFMLGQLIIWLAVSLTAAFIFPTKLPLDTNALESSWLDRQYVDNINMTDEHRLLANFFVDTVVTADTDERGDNRNQQRVCMSVDDLKNFQYPFCTQFTEFTPTSVEEYEPSPDELFPTAEPSPDAVFEASSDTDAETESDDEERILASSSIQSFEQLASRASTKDSTIPPPDSITVKPLPLNLYNELFLVYVAGKPKGTDHYRALAYLALPMMIMGPVFAAQALRKILLLVFAVIWIGLVTVVGVFGTASVLRPIMVPDAGTQLIQFCRLNYRIKVVDDWTMTVAELDIAVFVMTVLITILEVFRWFKESDYASSRRRFSKQTVTFEDVNNNDRNSRNLKW